MKDFELEVVVHVACEYSRFSLLFAAKDVSPGGTLATQRQTSDTDDVKSVRNLVRSAIGQRSSYIVLTIVY